MPKASRLLPVIALTLMFGTFPSRILLAADETPQPAPAPAPPHEPSKAPQAGPASVPSAAADVLSDPEIQKQLQGKTPEEAKAWGAQMSAKGLKRLPFDDLVSWNEIRTKMAAASPAVCAGFWKGGIDGSQMQKTLSSLGKEDMDRWTILSTRAIALEAKNAPHPPIAQDDVPELMKFVMSQQSEADRTRFQTLANKGAGITDEEACWLMTTTLQTLGRSGADQAARERSLRTLASLGAPK